LLLLVRNKCMVIKDIQVMTELTNEIFFSILLWIRPIPIVVSFRFFRLRSISAIVMAALRAFGVLHATFEEMTAS
jgi:hypothetical protein